MDRFVRAGEEDKEFIIKHMTDPIEAEKMVFEEEFNNTLAEMVNRLSEEFTEQFYSVVEHL